MENNGYIKKKRKPKNTVKTKKYRINKKKIFNWEGSKWQRVEGLKNRSRDGDCMRLQGK